MRQALDARIDHSTNRLEKFNPRIRQVFPYRGRNMKAFVEMIHHLAAKTTLVMAAFAGRLLIWVLLAH
jgi:hypothetical protein